MKAGDLVGFVLLGCLIFCTDLMTKLNTTVENKTAVSFESGN